MKKTRIVLVGALVLALAFVMGCKQNEELSVEEHRQGADKYEHIWEATYENNDYIRSALQFGANKNAKVNTAEIKVKMIYPGQGKAGVLFGVNPREVASGDTKETVYDFYAFAFGKNRSTGKLEAYVDYYQGLKSFNDKGGTSEKFGEASTVELEKKNFESFTGNVNDPITVVMKIAMKETAGSRDDTDGQWDLSIMSEDGKTTYWSATAVSALGNATAGKNGLNKANFKETGGLYSYGMLSALDNPKKADTKWNLNKDSLPSGVVLAAEEE